MYLTKALIIVCNCLTAKTERCFAATDTTQVATKSREYLTQPKSNILTMVIPQFAPLILTCQNTASIIYTVQCVYLNSLFFDYRMLKNQYNYIAI